jgi:membrane protein DedA with SNARE-associated domain
VVVVLGNVGVPLPEETVLALAGYLVCAATTRLPVVLVVGVVSAVWATTSGTGWDAASGGTRAASIRALVLGHPERLSTMADFIKLARALRGRVARFIPASGAAWPAHSRAGSGCASRDSS